MLVNENKPLSNQASKSTLTYDRRTSLISEDECGNPTVATSRILTAIEKNRSFSFGLDHLLGKRRQTESCSMHLSKKQN